MFARSSARCAHDTAMTSPVPTLRERLSAAVPRFPLKTAWPVAIRSSRAWGRRTGASPRLGGRTDVDRLLVLTAPATAVSYTHLTLPTKA